MHLKIIFLLLFSSSMNTIMLFDFNLKSNISDWRIVDDSVMGGISLSTFLLDTNGNGTFGGKVSTENNGGFCSVHYDLKRVSLKEHKLFRIRLKGDGKKYQFRVKSKLEDYYSYVYDFQTTSEWQTIEIPINELYATFRGRKLDFQNYDGTSLEEIAFFIGNKKMESFQLMVDKIEVK